MHLANCIFISINLKSCKFHLRMRLKTHTVRHLTKNGTVQGSVPPNPQTRVQSKLKEPPVNDPHTLSQTGCLFTPMTSRAKHYYLMCSKQRCLHCFSIKPTPLPTHNKHHTHSLKKHLTVPTAVRTKRPNTMLTKRTSLTCGLGLQFSWITHNLIRLS